MRYNETELEKIKLATCLKMYFNIYKKAQLSEFCYFVSRNRVGLKKEYTPRELANIIRCNASSKYFPHFDKEKVKGVILYELKK